MISPKSSSLNSVDVPARPPTIVEGEDQPGPLGDDLVDRRVYVRDVGVHTVDRPAAKGVIVAWWDRFRPLRGRAAGVVVALDVAANFRTGGALRVGEAGAAETISSSQSRSPFISV